MKMSLDTRFDGLTPSDAPKSAMEEKTAQIDRLCPDMMSCRVTVEQGEHRHQRRRVRQGQGKRHIERSAAQAEPESISGGNAS